MQFMKGLVLLAGLASTGSGEIAWQIQGQLSQDAWHRLYQLRSSETGSQLARIDGRTGETLWEISGQPRVDFNADCVDAERLYILTGDRMQALDVEKGTVIWNAQVSEEFVQNAGYLSCFRSSDQIFLSYARGQKELNKMAAVRKSDGQTLWTHLSTQTIHPIGADAERLYLSRADGKDSLTQALDQKSGDELWIREDEGVFYQLDEWQRLLRQGQGEIHRMDVQTGQELWRATMDGSYIYSQSQADAIYMQSDAGVTRLNPETGAHLWDLHFTQSAEAYTSTLILESGDVLMRESLYAQNQTRFKVLQGKSGQARWERTVEGLEAFITEDKDGHLFEQTPSTLNLLDANGQVLWNFQVPTLHGKVPKIGSVLSAEQQLFITLFESSGKYPPTSLAAVDWKTGAVKWVHESNEPLSLISMDQPALIVIGTMLSGRSFALYQ